MGSKMTAKRRDGMYLVLLGSLAFVLLGMALEHAVSFSMADFKSVYYGSRCLIQHADPYNESEFLRVYQAEGGDHATDPARARRAATRYINLPTTLLLIAPLAMLPWGPAHVLWIVVVAGAFILAGFSMWNLGADYAPVLSGGLICLLIANSEVLLYMGNTAGIAISLCVLSVWCFLKDRLAMAGVVCLAISLVLKPHDAGLVWLYFLLAGGAYRKRALQTLVVVAALSLPAALWVSQVAPHWTQEMQANLAATSAPGDLNDPGPRSMGGHGLAMVISLQSAISVFRDDPHIYNWASYLICAPLLLVWGYISLRVRPSLSLTHLALACIAALTMLPVYHRQYDAKLLLLTVPACALLWAEGGLVGRLAVMVTSAGIVLTGDIPWAILLGLIGKLHLPTTGLIGQILVGVLVFPVPLILLVIGVFYLWAYVRRCSEQARPHPLY